MGRPPCSTWVWVGRYQTGRNKHEPLGYENKAFVQRANQQASRVALLIVIAALLHNGVFIATQPGSSLIDCHPPWLMLERVFGDAWLRLHMWMQPFGGTSRKSTILFGSQTFLEDLWRPLDSTVQSSVVTCRTMWTPWESPGPMAPRS